MMNATERARKHREKTKDLRAIYIRVPASAYEKLTQELTLPGESMRQAVTRLIETQKPLPEFLTNARR